MYKKQRVSERGSSFSLVEVKSGLPQGFVLGLVLFLLYVNDMPDTLKSVVKMLVDDTKIYHRIKLMSIVTTILFKMTETG